MRLEPGLGRAGDPERPREVAVDLQMELAQALERDELHPLDERPHAVAGFLAGSMTPRR